MKQKQIKKEVEIKQRMTVSELAEAMDKDTGKSPKQINLILIKTRDNMIGKCFGAVTLLNCTLF